MRSIVTAVNSLRIASMHTYGTCGLSKTGTSYPLPALLRATPVFAIAHHSTAKLDGMPAAATSYDRQHHERGTGRPRARWHSSSDSRTAEKRTAAWPAMSFGGTAVCSGAIGRA
jgi:hypothetical protein